MYVEFQNQANQIPVSRTRLTALPRVWIGNHDLMCLGARLLELETQSHRIDFPLIANTISTTNALLLYRYTVKLGLQDDQLQRTDVR
jgi:hypothetical protein